MMQNSPTIDMYDNYGGNLEGTMNIPGQTNIKLGEPDFNTLDEPIKVTIMRDLHAVLTKFKHVLQPKEKKSLLKEWDLWGPLLLCTLMATILQSSTDYVTDYHNRDGGPEFAEVFVIVWVGALIVTLNSKLLGGNISFFQSVCVLGYCLLPTAIALILCRIVLLFNQSMFLFCLRFIIAMTGFGWATYASMIFLGDSQPDGKKGLAVYPIFLFYFIISWLVLSHTAE